jgi:TolB-like protein
MSAFTLLMAILTALFHAHSSYAEDVKKVAIVPFVMHAERDISFLRDGIVDMLGSRLSVKDELVVIEKGLVKRAIGPYQGALDLAYVSGLAAKLGADYALFGSLTVFGESVSLDATLVSLEGRTPPVAVFFQSKDTASLMPEVNKFAQKINTQFLGRAYTMREVEEAPPLPALERPAKSLPTPLKPKTGEPHRNSEDGPFWKSALFEIEVLGVAIGDVDADGHNEVVFISHNDVFVYRNVEGRFNKVGQIEGKAYYNFIGVDVADTNGNGRSEIFITDLRRNGGRLTSFVLEWDGTEFKKIADNENWYFRVLKVPRRGTILLGQKRGGFDIFISGVYELKWSNGRYVPLKRQILPKWLNIYGFTFGDILNNGQQMIVALAQDDRLRIVDREGNEEWTSSERYGGSRLYLDLASETAPEGRSGDTQEMEHFYLPQRVHIADLDNDGENEVVVVKNQDAARRLLSRLRLFESGHIECLAWDNAGLSQKRKSREFSGYVSDYVIGDLDNNGSDEIVFSLVAKRDSSISRARSFIVSWRGW